MTIILATVIMAAIIFTIIFWCTEHYKIAGAIIMIFGSIAILYGVTFWWPSFTCEQKVQPSGYECNWTFFTGCQIKVNNQWIPYEKWRVIE
jgi:hypothetical protein